MTIKVSGRCFSKDENIKKMANGHKCWTVVFIDIYSYDSNNLNELKNFIDGEDIWLGVTKTYTSLYYIHHAAFPNVDVYNALSQ